ncbi:hypothetical protein E8K88_14535 [Lampropedia aestuarii]|uniref:Tetratricopeptide repeat protein n=1 Tax=Lampropedia aestuarii TaxID=2562762 RepID=A0A4S5BHH4_9BURK|nr:hypothetical protein [Lampropedia aestuarii]THJ31529.1 hypothetical protein E8K88_14535 [Lampropedia aestuarii]
MVTTTTPLNADSGVNPQSLPTNTLPEQPELALKLELMDLLGYIYLQHGLPDKAAVLLTARDVLAPDNPKTLLTLAVAQLRSEKAQRALTTLERMILLGAIDASFHLVHGQVLQQLGRETEAASAMRAHIATRQVGSRQSNPSHSSHKKP